MLVCHIMSQMTLSREILPDVCLFHAAHLFSITLAFQSLHSVFQQPPGCCRTSGGSRACRRPPPEERGLTSQGRRQNERQKPCWDLICSQISGEDEGRGNHMRALPNWSVLSAPESRFIPPQMMRQEVDWFRSHRAKNGSADRERGLVKYWVAPYDFGEGDSLQLACLAVAMRVGEWMQSTCEEEDNHKKRQVGSTGVVAFVISVSDLRVRKNERQIDCGTVYWIEQAALTMFY